jgi:hypothetical protein
MRRRFGYATCVVSLPASIHHAVFRQFHSAVLQKGVKAKSSGADLYWCPLRFEKDHHISSSVQSSYRSSPQTGWQISKPVVVFDLDETLVSSCLTVPDQQAHFTAVRKHVDVSGVEHSFMALRPGLIPFLAQISELAHIVFWTASSHQYGLRVLTAIQAGFAHHFQTASRSSSRQQAPLWDIISPPPLPSGACGRFQFHLPRPAEWLEGKVWMLLHREHCLKELQFMKYLGHLPVPIDQVLLVDDKTRSFKLTPRSAVLCDPFSLSERIPVSLKRTISGVLSHSDDGRRGTLPLLTEATQFPAALQSSLTEFVAMEHESSARCLSNLCRVIRDLADGWPRVHESLDSWRPAGYEKLYRFSAPTEALQQQPLVGSISTERQVKPAVPDWVAYAEAWSSLSLETRQRVGECPIPLSSCKQ